eukprot:Rmarinus@m.20615
MNDEDKPEEGSAAHHDVENPDIKKRDAIEASHKEIGLLKKQLDELVAQNIELVGSRKKLYTHGANDAVIPTQTLHRDVLELDEGRRVKLEALSTTPSLPPVPFLADILRREVEEVAVKLESSSDYRDKVIAYYESRVSALQRKMRITRARFRQYASSSTEFRRHFADLSERLTSYEKQIELFSERLRFLRTRDPNASKNAQVISGREPEAEDLRRMFRWHMHVERCQRRVQTFFRRLQWSPFSLRFELLYRGVDAVTAPYTNETAESIPMLLVHDATVDDALRELGARYGVEMGLEYAGEQFLYRVKKTFLRVFQDQAAFRTFPVYGSEDMRHHPNGAPSGPTPLHYTEAPLPEEGSDVQTVTAACFTEDLEKFEVIPPVMLSSERTYLKKSNWGGSSLFEADESEASLLQEARLLTMMGNPDNILRMELGYLEFDNPQHAVKRVRDVSETHLEGLRRLVADRYGSTGRGAAASVSASAGFGSGAAGGDDTAALNASTASTTMRAHPTEPPIHKLQSYYYLRLLHARDAKLRVLRLLNYFRSIDRTLTVDNEAEDAITDSFVRWMKTYARKKTSKRGHDHDSSVANPNGSGAEAANGVPNAGQSAANAHESADGAAPPAASGAIASDEPTQVPAQNVEPEDEEDTVTAGLRTAYEQIPSLPIDQLPEKLFTEGQSRAPDSLKSDEETVSVVDAEGINVMYDLSMQDMGHIDKILLQIGTHYINNLRAHRSRFDDALIDRYAVVCDLYTCMADFLDAKRKLIDAYSEIYQNTCIEADRMSAQRVLRRLISQLPRLDLSANYFVRSFASETICMELHATLVREMTSFLADEERRATAATYAAIDAEWRKIDYNSREHDEFSDSDDENDDRMGKGVRKGGLVSSVLTKGFIPFGVGPYDLTGFADPVHEVTRNTKASFGQSTPIARRAISLVPNGLDFGVFHIHETLSCLLNLPILLEQCMEELRFVHEPGTRLIESGIQQALLMQAIVDWKLLSDEARISHMATLEEGRPEKKALIDETMLMEDAHAIELLIKELQSNPAEMQKLMMPSSKPAETVGPAPFYTRALELVRLHRGLQSNLYETELLGRIYRKQGRFLGRDVGRAEPDNLVFASQNGLHLWDEAGLWRSEDGPIILHDYASLLAISEFESAFAKFDFMSLGAVKQHLDVHGLDVLRRALHVQVLQKNALVVAILYNQPSMDHVVRTLDKVEMRELDLEQTNPSKSYTLPSEVLRTLPCDRHRPPGIGTQLTTRRKREVEAIAPCFLSLYNRKLPHRNTVMNGYQDKSVRALRTSYDPQSKKKLAEFKYQLIEKYVKSMLDDLHGFALKTQVVRTSARLARAVETTLPHRGLPFILCADEVSEAEPAPAENAAAAGGSATNVAAGANEKEQYSSLAAQALATKDTPVDGTTQPEQSAAKAKAKAAAEKESRKLYLSDAIGPSAWHLRTFSHILHIDQLDDLRVEIDDFQRCIRLISHLHTVFIATRMLSKLGLPAREAVKPMSAGDTCAHEMVRVKNELDNLQNPSSATEVMKYLGDKALVTHHRLRIALRQFAMQMLNKGNNSACHQGLRALRMLEGTPLPSVYSSTWLDGSPHEVPYVGCHVASPDATVGLVLLQLSDADRNYCHASIMEVDLQCEDVLSERMIYATSQPLLAIATLYDFLNTTLQLFQLQDEVVMHEIPGYVCPPRAKADLLAYETVMHQKVVRVVEETGFVAMKDTELEKRKGLVLFLTHHLEKEIIRQLCSDLRAMHGSIMAELDQRLSKNQLPCSYDDYQKKSQFVRDFIEKLRAVATLARTEQGQSAYMIPANLLDEIMDEFAVTMTHWAEDRLYTRTKSLLLTLVGLSHRLFVYERNLSAERRARIEDQRTMQKRVRADAADLNYDLVFRNEALQRQADEARDKLRNQRDALKEEAREEYEKLVQDLTVELTTTKNKFKEYRSELYQETMESLQEVKKSSMLNYIEHGLAPEKLKNNLLQMAEDDEKNQEKAMEVHELQRTITKVKTMFQLKEMALRAHYGKLMASASEEKRKANETLWESREDVERRMAIMKQQLDMARSTLSATEMEMESVRKELALANRNKAQLVQWKIVKGKEIQELEKKIARFEGKKAAKKAQSAVTQSLSMEVEDREDQMRKMKAEETQIRKENQRLKARLQKEQRLKMAAYRKVDGVRQVHSTGQIDKGMDPLNDVAATKVGDLRTRLDRVERDNETLRHILRQYGIEPRIDSLDTGEVDVEHALLQRSLVDQPEALGSPGIGYPPGGHGGMSSPGVGAARPVTAPHAPYANMPFSPTSPGVGQQYSSGALSQPSAASIARPHTTAGMGSSPHHRSQNLRIHPFHSRRPPSAGSQNSGR